MLSNGNNAKTINEQLPDSPYTYIEPAIRLDSDVDEISVQVPAGFKVLIAMSAVTKNSHVRLSNEPTSSVTLPSLSYVEGESYYFEMPASPVEIVATTQLWGTNKIFKTEKTFINLRKNICWPFIPK